MNWLENMEEKKEKLITWYGQIKQDHFKFIIPLGRLYKDEIQLLVSSDHSKLEISSFWLFICQKKVAIYNDDIDALFVKKLFRLFIKTLVLMNNDMSKTA